MKLNYCVLVAGFLFLSCQKEVNVTEKPSATAPEQAAGMATDLSAPDVDVALNFINGYIDNANKMSEAVGAVEWVAVNPLATDNYKAALKKVYGDAEMIDADLVFDAQDYDDTGMEIESADEAGYVVLRGINWKEFKVILKLVKQNNQWLVEGCGNINIPQDKRLPR